MVLPLAGGVGLLPVALASSDSSLPSIGIPDLVDIAARGPTNALEGEKALAIGALAPDTATVLPSILAVGLLMVTGGLVLRRQRRRGRSGWRTGRARRRGGWRLRSVYRRRLGNAVAATGAIVLMLSAKDYVDGVIVQREARAAWLSLSDSPGILFSNHPVSSATAIADSAVLRAGSSADSVAPAENAAALGGIGPTGVRMGFGDPIARLVIPSIGLDEVVLEGVGAAQLNGGPGHFPGSVLPGEAGNSIVSAHRDRHFRRVGELTVGSRIRTQTRAGWTEWVVTERRIVSRDTPSLFQEPSATLTLTTCWPLRYFGPAPDRLIIIAKPA